LTSADGFHFELDGERIPAATGDTIAAALARARHLAIGASPRGAPRGVYCGIGVCFECVVEVEGIGRVRSCLQHAAPGMRVHGR
jgi:D-hydroxyproline dehydrogenase subunit alpha